MDQGSIVLGEGNVEVLLHEGADCANQDVTLGLSDRIQMLDYSTIIVTGGFERTVGDRAEIIKSLLMSFSDDVVWA